MKSHSSFSHQLNFVLLSAILLGWGIGSAAVRADSLDEAADRAKETFKSVTFTAVVDLETSGKYDVDPDGNPTEGKSQGRHKRRGIGQRDIAFASGSGGSGIYLRFDNRDGEIKVTLQPKRGPTMHAALITVHFNRPLTPSDVDPRVIARALAPYVEFEGLAVGQEIDAALDQLAKAPTSGAAPQAQAPTHQAETITALTARAVPDRVAPGADVVLQLDFTVGGPAGSAWEAKTTRTLSFGGSILPGFPVTHVESLPPGEHTSRYRQPIPATAADGTYEYRGEACVGGDCISRTVTFEVIR